MDKVSEIRRRGGLVDALVSRGCLVYAESFVILDSPLSILQAIDGVVSLALCPQDWPLSQDPQHFIHIANEVRDPHRFRLPVGRSSFGELSQGHENFVAYTTDCDVRLFMFFTPLS